MLNDTALNALRDIAFGETSSAKDRISACSTLYKNDVDVQSVKQMLEYVIALPDTKDKDRVAACALLLHIDRRSEVAPQEQIDEDTVAEALKQQYLRFG